MKYRVDDDKHETVSRSKPYNCKSRGLHHRLNGSSSPVLTATFLSYGKAKNSTPHRIKTTDPIETKIWQGGFLTNGWNIRKNFYSCTYTSFQKLTYRLDPSADFCARWLKRRGLAQGCAFFGLKNLKLIFNVFIRKNRKNYNGAYGEN